VTLAERLVDRAARTVGAKTSRRGFLARSAIVGSALAVAPAHFVLRPGTAYAAICSCRGQACACGSRCCDGWTEFCCSITGENRCPPGTMAAGWWKVDRSTFCSDGPRFYFDCNAGCGGCVCGSSGVCSGACTGMRCGCTNGDCGLRATGCNLFRYGQCNQHVPCVGPIVCRVVGCIPPWDIDPTCTTLTMTSESTRSHDSGCLHQPVGSVDSMVRNGGGVRIEGWALDPDVAGPVNVRVDRDGRAVTTIVANRPSPDMAGYYPGHGSAHGFEVTVPAGGELCVVALSSTSPGTSTRLNCRRLDGTPTAGTGYWLVESTGKLHAFGAAEATLGSLPLIPVANGSEVVDLAVTADGSGLYALDSRGEVRAYGSARHLGDAPATGLAAGERWSVLVTAPGGGYWVYSDRGRGVAFGVPDLGGVEHLALFAPILAGAATASGRGLWLLGGDGGVFTFGDARFRGSVPQFVPLDRLVRPLSGMIPEPSGNGYWLIAEDGGVFAFSAPFRGSLPEIVPVERLEAPIIGGVPYGNGYVLVGQDGGVFNFSNLPFLGSLGGVRLDSPVVAIAAFSR
jgi:hypothetical protein